jgi:signal transduction histidine kinase
VVLIFCRLNTYAQTEPEQRRQDSLDALIRSVGSHTDTAAAKTLADAAVGYINFDSEYALKVATRADNLVTSATITPLRIHVMIALADVCYADNKYPEAIKYYDSALTLARRIGANAEIAYALIGQSLIERDQGAMAKAFAKSLEAMEFAKRAGDHRLTVTATMTLGLGYFAARDFVSSDSLYAVALQQCQGNEDDDLRAGIYNYRGILIDQMQQPRRAIETYHNGLTLEQQLGRSRRIGRISSNIALVFMRVDKFDSALAYQKICLQKYEKTKYDAGLANSLSIIGMTQVKLGKYQDAIASAKRAIKLSEPSHFFQEMNYGYYVLTEAYSGLGDYKNALEANKQMAAIQDSMYNAASAEKLVELETSKKEQEIKLLQSKQAQENIIRNALIAGALTLVVFVVVLIRGNSRRKRDNARLAELNDKLFDANEELSLLTSEKDEILNIVTHGLKSQIFGVRSLADSMATDLANDDAPINTASLAEMSRTISQASTQMFSLVTNLLTVNAAEQGLLKSILVKTDVADVLRDVCDRFKEYAAVKNITLRLEASQSEVLNAIADEQMLREVLENLLSNAVKYSPHGKNVFVRMKAGNDAVRVEVQDEGQGISEEDRKKLFGKFSRLSARPTGGEHSTGLGLSIVKTMVEAMNGRVWCESEVGDGLLTGATFIVELPTAP